MKNTEKTTFQNEFFTLYPSPRGMSLTALKPEKTFRYIENLYVDYEGGGDCVESIPGFRKIYSTMEGITALAIRNSFNKSIMFIENQTLYKLSLPSPKRKEKILSDLSKDCKIFSFGEDLYLIDKQLLLRINNEESVCQIFDDENIIGCNSIALFDDKIFLSGSNKHPNRLFYFSTDQTEQSVNENYITLPEKAISILFYRNRLWAFTDSSILCYDGGNGYPLLTQFDGVNPLGQTCILENQIAFLTDRGLWAIEDPMDVNNARLVCLSKDISPLLSKEKLEKASLTRWKDYLAIGCLEKIYLLDRRNQDGGWYVLNKIGSYADDKQVYRYSKSALDGYSIHKNPGEIAEGEIISVKNEDGMILYFSREGREEYSVYPTEQKIGGAFSPEKTLLSDGARLIFSTDHGIFIFNDKRYESGELTDFYTFDSHAPRYMIITERDDFGLPMTEKGSFGESLLIRLKAKRSTKLKIGIITDGEMKSEQTVITPESKFKSEIPISNGMPVRINEHSVGWLEKQIVIKSEEHDSPISLYSLSFKYQPKEKIKKG